MDKLTVGELKKRLEKAPDDAIVHLELIEHDGFHAAEAQRVTAWWWQGQCDASPYVVIANHESVPDSARWDRNSEIPL